MRLLLDTHVLIWWVGRERLSEAAGAAITAPGNDVLVSAATIWEAEIKTASGKLDLRVDLIEQCERNRFAELPVSFEHGRAAARLPLHHRDPFDRALIAQAQLERLTLVTRDPVFNAYDVTLLAA